MHLYNGRQLVIIWILLVAWSCTYWMQARSSQRLTAAYSARLPYIYEIHGEVTNSGYYFFEQAQTLASLLAAAGGARASQADAQRIIPGASAIIVGKEIYITDIPAAARLNFFLPIPLATATIEDLMLIPGIGERTAAAIVEYRRIRGRIVTLEELLQVQGIGEKRLKVIAPYLMP